MCRGRRREDPGEGKPQEGNDPPTRLTAGREDTDSQGERGPEGGPGACRHRKVEVTLWERQEGKGHREVTRLLGRGNPWRGKPGRAQRDEKSPRGERGRKPPRGYRKPEGGRRRRSGIRCGKRTFPTDGAKRRRTSWEELVSERERAGWLRQTLKADRSSREDEPRV